MPRAYYAGGARVVIDTVPMKLARKPSAHNVAWMKDAAKPGASYLNARERADARVKDAQRVIQIYAETLGIDVKAAKARIERQRLDILANPVVDLSMEYDL